MNTKTRFVLMFTLALLGGAALWTTLTWAAPDAVPLAGGAPAVVAYQGEVQVGDMPYAGAGYFKFAVVDAAGTTTSWSNDGSSIGGGEPDTAVLLMVSEGLFSVLLGDTTLSGMSQPLAAAIFSQPNSYLRVWFSASDSGPFEQLTPDTRIAAVPYALQAQAAAEADTVDGYEGAVLEESAEIDSDIAAHTAAADAHHSRYTDAETWAAVLTNDGAGSSLDADMIDGYEGAVLEESVEIDSDIAAHTTAADAHHSRYTDAEAWAAVLTNDGAGSGLEADTVDGLHASDLGGHYQNVVVVAQSGGDYASVQAAIDSIGDAAAGNPYLVWVAPGVYTETVALKPHVHLQGAGQAATIITSAVSNTAFPPTQATLVLASDTSLRDLTVGNGGTGTYNLALLAPTGAARVSVLHVTAQALGNGIYNYAVLLTGSGTEVTLEQVTASGESGSSSNVGLYNYDSAQAALLGGSFSARGGSNSFGIGNISATLEAESVTAEGENGSNENIGLYNYNNAQAVLHGGSFTGRGGINTYGIRAFGLSSDSNTFLEAEGVTALGENGSSYNYGLEGHRAAVMLRGGSFTGRGGGSAIGIQNISAGTLAAEGVTALGENGGSYNYGLANHISSTATLHGGSFTGRGGGGSSYGLYNYGDALVAEGVTALGENGGNNYGLYNNNNAQAALHGGSFSARGGSNSFGIGNISATLEAENAAMLGENGASGNMGLYNYNNAQATLRGSAFTGRGGTAFGIRNDNATLEAESVTALGENGIYYNYGLHNLSNATANLTQSVLAGTASSAFNDSGSVTISNSRLVGGYRVNYGIMTCVAVSRNTTFNANGCP